MTKRKNLRISQSFFNPLKRDLRFKNGSSINLVTRTAIVKDETKKTASAIVLLSSNRFNIIKAIIECHKYQL